MRTLAVLAALLVTAAGCGPSRSGSLGPVPSGAPRPSSAPPPSPTPTPSAVPTAQLTIEVWYTRGGTLFPTRRTRPATIATSRLALTELVAGPTPAEAGAGLSGAVAPGTTFGIKGITAGVATVTFPASFYDGGRDLARLRQAQVVYTLTQFPTVSKVGFQSDGEATGWPLGRADYADLLPPIVVLNPVIGQRVASPVAVSGTADVFEAVVSLRVLDASGAEIAAKFTTASCGTGCRGDYATTVPYRSDHDQPGTVEVYEVSMRDGSRVHVVDVPVT